MVRPTVLTALLIVLVRPLAAQCPDGSPPPCVARARPAPASALSVAVLTFDNLTRDSADAYLTEGLANDISAQLAQIQRLSVTSRSMVRRVAASDAAPTALGRSLNAAYLVTGGVQRGGARIRVSVELVRAANAQTVWSNQFDRASADLLSIQQDIATNVAAGIAGRLLPGERSTLATRPTTSSEAYDHILRGDFLVNQRTVGAFERALAEFETAARLDPGSARAFASLGYAFGLCADWGYSCRGLPDDSLHAAGRRSVERALAIDSLSPQAYRARAELEYDLDLPAGLRDINRAIALEPRNGEFYGMRGWLLAESLRFDEALAAYARSLELDPGRAVTWEHLARIATIQRRYPDALAAYDSALRIEPELVPVFERRAILRAYLGDRNGARSDADAFVRRQANPASHASWRAGVEALIAAWAGDTATARAAVDSLVAAGRFTFPLVLAQVRLGRGAEVIVRAGQENEFDPFWAMMPFFDPIRDDARFQAMLQRYRRNRAPSP